jgi:hypothetical protein
LLIELCATTGVPLPITFHRKSPHLAALCQQGHEYFLGVCLRAATDPVFATFNGRNPADLTQEEVDHVLGMCYCTRKEAEAALTPETVVLCSHRSQVGPSPPFLHVTVFDFPLPLLKVFSCLHRFENGTVLQSRSSIQMFQPAHVNPLLVHVGMCMQSYLCANQPSPGGTWTLHSATQFQPEQTMLLHRNS